jgi:predicted ATPase/class 3 adenylate cyclase
MSCPRCGFDSPGAFAFCGRCGAPTPTSEVTRAADDRHSSRAERRQLTVVFCDLVGSTALSTQLDPEELNDLTREYERVCAEVIERHEGRIARFVGDGILVYFGYPLSHEDDAQRAVRSALDIVAAVSALGESLGKPLHVRVAVHTGLVVVGQLGGRANPDPMAISGETPNVAARLQTLAGPNMVVTSAATYRLIQGFFRCRSLGAPALRGVAAPIEAYEILEPTGIETRFERAVASGLTPFVSREDEVGLLLARWEQIKALQGQVVMLRGEAGIGKSRLVRALVERTAGEPLWELSCRCSPYYQNTALYPAIDGLQHMLQYDRNDDVHTKFAKLARLLEQFAFGLAETLPLFASLLSLPANDRYPASPMSAHRQKQKTFEAIVELLMRAAEKGPVRLVVEDLHWADSSTLDLIDLLIERLPGARLLLVLAFRPEFALPWPLQAHITEMTLARFSRAATERMIQAVAGDKPLPAEVVEEIIEKTEGVPLFVEELTRMVLESPLLEERDGRYLLTGALPSLAIPSTLHDSLMTRLDRLGTAKEVAQLGATIGRDFSFELLRAVSPLDETILTSALNRLVHAELLEQNQAQNRRRYSFRHALIRDAAYDSLLHSQQRLYHGKVAEVLQERFGETVDARPELLAHHFTQAGLIEQAIPYWQRAGQRALERSANKEAISHLSRGIELLRLMPESAQRLQQELVFYVALGGAEMVAKGFASVEAGEKLARARKLCEQVGESPLVFQVFWMLWVFHEARAENDQAREAAEECLRFAQSAQNPGLLLEAHHALGASLSLSGEFAEGLHHLEQGSAIYDPQQHAAQAYVYGQDAGVACLCHGAWSLWFLGYPDRARERIGEALALARRLSHPVSKAAAANFGWMVYQLLRDPHASREQADAAVTLSTEPEQEFELWRAWGMIGQGSALTESGQVEDGIARLRAGMSALRMTGAQISLPSFNTLLAQAHRKAGRAEEALRILAEAETMVSKTGERWCLAPLCRLRGQLLLRRGEDGNEEAAEECFRRAIAVAQEQRAKSLELRAAMSLSRLWKKQGKRVAARQVLSEPYNWFTEGFDTPDLREARALIAQM